MNPRVVVPLLVFAIFCAWLLLAMFDAGAARAREAATHPRDKTEDTVNCAGGLPAFTRRPLAAISASHEQGFADPAFCMTYQERI